MKENSPPRRRHDSEATRSALLEAAEAEFAERGFAGAGIRSIATAAGANPAMISYHFGGKEGLYQAMLTSILEDVAPRFDELRASEASAEQRLEGLVMALAELADRRPAFPRILLREHLESGARIQGPVVPRLLQFFRTTEDVLRQGEREGVFRRVEPHAFHLALVGSLVFFYATQPYRDGALARAELPVGAPSEELFLRQLAGILVRGLASGEVPPREGPETRKKR